MRKAYFPFPEKETIFLDDVRSMTLERILNDKIIRKLNLFSSLKRYSWSKRVLRLNGCNTTGVNPGCAVKRDTSLLK